jgi:hypothetical protein
MPEIQGNKGFDREVVAKEFQSWSRPQQETWLAELEALKKPVEYSYDPSPEREDVEVLEIFVPQRLAYLPGLYEFLREQLQSLGYEALFTGYSLFPVQGAFRGERIYDESTLIVRLIYDRTQFEHRTVEATKSVENKELFLRLVDQRIDDLAQYVIQITGTQEEEIWIMQYRARLARFVRKERPP